SPSLTLTGSLSVDAWINASSFGTVTSIVTKEYPGGVSPYNLSVSNGQLRFGLTFSAAAQPLSGPGGCDGAQCFVTGNTPITTDSFHHVAGVYDDTTKSLSVYVDGSLDGVATFNTVGSPYSSGLPLETLRIGRGRRDLDGAGTNFNGLIDEVHLF